ncbi:MAG: inositol monophosphatase family protein [Acidimicrobiales bacterium]
MSDAGPTVADDLAFARRMADTADVLAMATFTGAPLAHDTKTDGSPVTDTDRSIEATLMEMVSIERPDDGFVGEEVGPHPGRNERRWIVDGIDGTVLFVRGDTGWGTQIALESAGRVVVGVSTGPAMGRRWWAALGGGAWTSSEGGDGPRPLVVSQTSDLGEASWSVIPPLDVLDEDTVRSAERLVSTARYVAPVQHSALMVAEGLVDTSIQVLGQVWDFAALALIVEEAGGRYSHADGRWTIDDGPTVVYSNGHLHDPTTAAITQS